MKYALLLSTLVFGACVGSELPGPPIQNTPDAFVETFFDAPAPPPDSGPTAGCVDRTATPLPAFIHPQSNTARAGEGCTGASGGACHNIQAGNTHGFIMGGTLYKSGTLEPDVGVTILIFPDGAIEPIKMVTDTAGNFYAKQSANGGYTIEGGTGAALPATAAATVCPTLVKGHLSGKLTKTPEGGNCNGCHATEVNMPGTQAAIHY